jgi:hypothetical protein
MCNGKFVGGVRMYLKQRCNSLRLTSFYLFISVCLITYLFIHLFIYFSLFTYLFAYSYVYLVLFNNM